VPDQPAAPGDRPEGIAGMLRFGIDAGQEPTDSPTDSGGQRSALTPIRTGTEIDGYQIYEEVGRGGMGIVYRAKELSLDRIVAIKVLRPHIVGDPTAAKRFRAEASLAARLRHDNIISIHAIDSREPPRYFVMDFVKGPSLEEKVAQEGALAPAQAVRIALDVCEALIKAHEENVLHRDIKPANILLENGIERVKVTDFGIAQESQATFGEDTIWEPEGKLAGTPDFMAPEQKESRKLDEKADVFSLGMTLYFMLTARTARLTSSAWGAAFLFTEQEYMPPSTDNPVVSDQLDEVVLRMIAIDRRHRYRDCKVVAKELSRVAACAERPAVSRSARSLLRRAALSRVGKLLMVIAVVIMGAGVLIVMSQGRSGGGEPHHLRIDGSSVTVFGQNGQPIWSIGVDGSVVKADLANLLPDKPPFLVVGVAAKEGNIGKDAGKVIAYDSHGNMVWTTDTTAPYPYRGDTDNRMNVRDLLVADLWQDGNLHVVAVSDDLGKFPCNITVIDRNGAVERTYWNPGQLHYLLAFKPSKGSRLRILAWGLNNDMRASRPGADRSVNFGAIVCLDPETMAGEAPPRRGRIGTGTELWYGLLLPQGVSIGEVKIRPGTPGTSEGEPGQLIQISVSNSSVLLLDEDGRYQGTTYGDIYKGAEEAHIELQE
jgi:hypothetical protein